MMPYEVIVRQMMRKVKVEDPVIRLLSRRHVDVFEFKDVNEQVLAR